MPVEKDGGPAFPRSASLSVAAGGIGDPGCEGMTLRDWFAGQALAGILSNPETARSYKPGLGRSLSSWCSEGAYNMADAMLAEREKEPTK